MQRQVTQGLASLACQHATRQGMNGASSARKESRVNQSTGHQTGSVAVRPLGRLRPGPQHHGYDVRMLAFSCAQAFSASLNCASTLESGEWAGMLRMWFSLRTAALNPLPAWMSPCATAPRGALAGGLAFFTAEDALHQTGRSNGALCYGSACQG